MMTMMNQRMRWSAELPLWCVCLLADITSPKWSLGSRSIRPAVVHLLIVFHQLASSPQAGCTNSFKRYVLILSMHSQCSVYCSSCSSVYCGLPWKCGFSIVVSLWIPSHLYITSDSPKIILKAMPDAYSWSVKDWDVVKEDQAAQVNTLSLQFSYPCWLRVGWGKYRDVIGYLFNSEQMNNFITILYCIYKTMILNLFPYLAWVNLMSSSFTFTTDLVIAHYLQRFSSVSSSYKHSSLLSVALVTSSLSYEGYIKASDSRLLIIATSLSPHVMMCLVYYISISMQHHNG